MAMGRRKKQRQQALFVEAGQLARGPGHPFYRRLNQLLDKHEFDAFVEAECAQYYADRVGRPSLAPAVYFRLLLIGYFEGVDSERGIAWRVADSMSLREFLGFELSDAPPDHSTISRNRRLISVESHQEVFVWVLQTLAKSGLLRSKTLGIDSTTLEANAALRSIVRRDSGERCDEFLGRLAKESGIETPTRADLAKLDRKRKGKGKNDDWKNPHDPDAKITKMQDGRTRLAHKVEHMVDMESTAVLSVTIHGGCEADSRSFEATVEETLETLGALVADPEAATRIYKEPLTEIVADKGYHSNAIMRSCRERGIRSYISEPNRGRRNWKGKAAERDATYANRRRIRGNRGKALLRQRGEKLERGFAHGYTSGNLRRTHLRGHANIRKRLLLHIAGLNLGLVMRQILGVGKPKALQGRLAALATVLGDANARLERLLATHWRLSFHRTLHRLREGVENQWIPRAAGCPGRRLKAGSATAC